MATKKQIAEQAMRILAGGHLKPDRNLDIREIMLALDQLRDRAIRISVYENMKMGVYEVDSDYLSYHENVVVNADTAKNLRYLTLPGSPISLPHEMGIYQISPMQNQQEVFHRIPSGSLAIYKNTQAIDNEVNTYYWSVKDKVYFKNLDVSIEDVLILMAKSSKDVLEDEDYPLSPDAEAEVLGSLIELFSITKKIPHDELEDGQK